MASGNDPLRAVRELSVLLSGVRVNDVTVGLVGQLTGALYAMQRATTLEHEPRVVVGTGRALSYRGELARCRSALSRNTSPTRAWLAGFYYHSALARIASGADRITKKLKGGRTLEERRQNRVKLFARTPQVEKVYKAVNQLKHDFEGCSARDELSVADTLKALRAVIVVARRNWPRR